MVSKPDDPVKDDYNFVAWILNNVEFDFNEPITEDLILVTKWAEKVYYTIIFYDDLGNIIKEETI